MKITRVFREPHLTSLPPHPNGNMLVLPEPGSGCCYYFLLYTLPSASLANHRAGAVPPACTVSSNSASKANTHCLITFLSTGKDNKTVGKMTKFGAPFSVLGVMH